MATFSQRIALAFGLMALSGPGHGANISVILGDVDCFGEAQIHCENGFFPTDPSFDNASGSDPAGMDEFTNHGVLSFSFDLMLGAAMVQSASLELRVAGVDIFVQAGIGPPLADPVEGMGFYLNGGLLGSYYEPAAFPFGIEYRTIKDLNFAIPLSGLFLNGTNDLSLVPETDFGLVDAEHYAVDFVRLALVVAMPPPIPLPGALPLLAGALAAGFAARRLRAPRRRG